MAERKQSGRVPDVVGAIPVVGGLVRGADEQMQWAQDLLEQQARLVSQLPATLKTLNDSIEAFNATIQRLDRTVTRIETATNSLVAPLEKAAAVVDPARLADLPELLDVLRREAVPALRAATDTQRQVALIGATLDRIVAVLGELPGAGILRRMAARPTESPD
ncbi:MAG: hypothetical protein ACTHMS_05645 [Jatrophihabitans sp.]|uniref:hypothetical protein n=1 Tax=Jatrophihabitans sp. TaxID=1932789 RepID=UPI003F7F44CB